jgi:hypothetical protein
MNFKVHFLALLSQGYRAGGLVRHFGGFVTQCRFAGQGKVEMSHYLQIENISARDGAALEKRHPTSYRAGRSSMSESALDASAGEVATATRRGLVMIE